MHAQHKTAISSTSSKPAPTTTPIITGAFTELPLPLPSFDDGEECDDDDKPREEGLSDFGGGGVERLDDWDNRGGEGGELLLLFPLSPF